MTSWKYFSASGSDHSRFIAVLQYQTPPCSLLNLWPNISIVFSKHLKGHSKENVGLYHYQYWQWFVLLFESVIEGGKDDDLSWPKHALFVYLCICICVFVHETLGNISLDILRPRAFRKWFVWSKTSYSGVKWRCYRCGTDGRTDGRTANDDQGKIELLSLWMLEGWVLQYFFFKTNIWGELPSLQCTMYTVHASPWCARFFAPRNVVSQHQLDFLDALASLERDMPLTGEGIFQDCRLWDI